MKKHLIDNQFASSCYFRSSVEPPYRKALIKITDWCNLHCAHCFVSAGKHGETMPFDKIRDFLIPNLVECKVISATLTGGEPFAHPDIMQIVQLFRSHNIKLSICTNGTLTSEEQIKILSEIGGISVNVSLDGFAENSHGKFRGDKKSFYTTIETTKLFAKYGLLKGILCTPNTLSDISEYQELCEFAISNKATYVLMNPLSLFGRGFKSKQKLGSPNDIMNKIREVTETYQNELELVNIRFPNKNLPLSACEAGNIIYVFTNGDTTVCPYLVFAAENSNSKYSPQEFMVGNVFKDFTVAKNLDTYNIYEKFPIGQNSTCGSCNLNSTCKKGCPASVIANGATINEVDKEQCPKHSS